jgi:hypothetical protein
LAYRSFWTLDQWEHRFVEAHLRREAEALIRGKEAPGP